MRDVFTMGARPIAMMNALRFGEPDIPRRGIWCPAWFAASAAMAIAWACPRWAAKSISTAPTTATSWSTPCAWAWRAQDKIFLSAAKGAGNPVVYIGSKTGRDGIHGATMASRRIRRSQSEEKRPTVQVGDPFTEKLLLEACLELMATDAIIAIQDMGAAGLTSSSAEMADKGGSGIELDLDKVPQREDEHDGL